MFRNTNLRGQILIPVCSTVGIIFLSVFSWFILQQNSIARNQAIELANEIGEKYGNEFKISMEVAIESAQTLANTFESMKAQKKLLSREETNEMFRHQLRKNSELFGIYTAWEPNTFDGNDALFKNTVGHDKTGGYYPWVFKQGNDFGLQPLKIPYETEWYKKSKNSRQDIVFNPSTWKAGGKSVTVVDIVTPIINNGKFTGIVGTEIEISEYKRMISAITPFEIGFAYLISNDGKFVAHPNESFIGTNVVEHVPDDKKSEIIKAIKTGQSYQINSINDGVEFIQVINPVTFGKSETPWSFGIAVPVDKIVEDSRQMMWLAVILGLISMLVIVCIIFIIVKQVVTRISIGVKVTQAISVGDLNQSFEVRKNDELGILGRSLNHMVEMLKVKESIAKSISIGDLRPELSLASDKDELGKALQEMKENLAQMILKIKSGVVRMSGSLSEFSAISSQMSNSTTEMSAQSTTIAGAAEQITAGIGTLASSNSEMNANVQSIAATSTEVSQNMKDISHSMETLADSIHQVSEKSENAQDVARKAIEMSNTSTDKMSQLSESARKIGEFSQIIKEIAQQTNLLALNANIEAASAGEAGKGFAVVANEIKELANQSSRSAEDISNTINEIQQNTELSVQSMNDVANIITNIDQSTSEMSELSRQGAESVNIIVSNVKESTVGVGEVSGLINEISSATDMAAKTSEEFTASVSEISRNMQELNCAVSETSIGVEQVHKEVASLSEISDEMTRMVEQFKLREDYSAN